MTYPVNSDGPRKPIDSLAEQVRGKSKIVEPSILPLTTEKPSQTGTPSEGDRIPQDSAIIAINVGNELLGKLEKEFERQKHENKKIDRIIWSQR